MNIMWNSLKVLTSRISAWLLMRRVDEEFERELNGHLVMLTAENMRRGMTAEEARRTARLRLGGPTQLREANRELRGLPLLETLLQDLRYSLRMLRKNTGLTLLIVLMLGLGIGVNATVFCWIQTIVLNPLPGVSKPENLVSIVPYYRGNANSSSLSYPDFRDLVGLKQVFSGVMGTHYAAAILTVNGENQWIYGRVATANTFEVLGGKPEIGRGFLPEEDEGEGGHAVLVISHSLWQEHFGADPNIIGRKVELNRHLFTIVGVAPGELQGASSGYRTDFWAPLVMHNKVLQYGSFDSRTFRWVTPLARLLPRVNPERAEAAVRALSIQLEKAYPDSNKEVSFHVFPLRKSPIGGASRVSAHPANSFCSGRWRAVDRGCKRGKFAFCTRSEPRKRDCYPAGDRSAACSTPPAIAHGKSITRWARRGARSLDRALDVTAFSAIYAAERCGLQLPVQVQR